MHRRLVCIVVALAAAAGASSASAAGFARTLYVVNESTVSDAQLANDLPAFQAAISTDFAPAWGVDATLVQVASEDAVPADGWRIVVRDDSDSAGALGYHELTDAGVPVSYVFVKSSLADGIPWTLVFDHEAKEMLADPYINRAAQGPRREWLVEVGDPVERLTYTRPAASGAPVPLSDFVTPAWYGARSRGPFDFLGRLRRPFQLAKGGYAAFWGAGGWTPVFAR